MNTLNTRQWKLYTFIKNYSKRGEIKNRRDIQNELNDLYPIMNENIFRDNNARLITSDIQEINDCKIVQKIIISTSSGIKIGTKQEVKSHIKNKEKQLKQELKRLSLKKYKMKKNNQTKITFGKYERDYYESFIDDINK